MKSFDPKKIRELIKNARSLPMGQTALDVLLEAVRLADLYQLNQLSIEARYHLMYVARNTLRGDLLISAFNWSLAKFDQNPELFHGRDLFWEYEMVIGQASNLDAIPRTKIESLVQDFSKRLQEYGHPDANLLPLRCQRSIAPDLGDYQLAQRVEDQLRLEFPSAYRYPRDLIEANHFLGNDKLILQTVSALRPQDFALEDYGSIMGNALLSLLRDGQEQEAIKASNRCLLTVDTNRCYYWHYGEIMKVFTLSGQINKAISLYARCQNAIKPFTDPLTRLHLYLDTLVLLDRLLALDQKHLAVQLHHFDGPPAEEQGYNIEQLRNYYDGQCQLLAQRFDQRNGTTYFTAQIKERERLQSLARPLKS